MNCFEFIISSITAIIAIFAALITYQQYYINKTKFKFELFDKRFLVFSKLKEFIILVNKEGGKISIDEINQFNIQTIEHKFLFDKKINDYFKNLLSNVFSLRSIETDMKNNLNGQINRIENQQKLKELTFWFTDQVESIESLFQVYLSIKER